MTDSLSISAPERTSALDSLPPTRRQIVELLKRNDGATADLIAERTGITASAVRQHLTSLRADGLIRFEAERAGAGRPIHHYSLTAGGDALFPRNYVDLTNELLAYVGEEDADLLARIWERRAQARFERAAKRLAGLSFAERVAGIALILDEDGYLADFTDLGDGRFRLTEHNCAVLAVAQRDRHACSTELGFLQALLPDATVTRTAHRLNGQHICAYDIERVSSF